MNAHQVQIRQINPTDDAIIGGIIKEVLIEYDAARSGTAYEDPQLFNLTEYYKKHNGIYFVALIDEEVAGGCGIAPLPGVEGVMELQKMYLLSKARKKGVAKKLLEVCIDFARGKKYKWCYLETLPAMIEAQEFYYKNGFVRTSTRLGNTGHYTCDVLMIKKIE